jgi:uncharacterized membrane protein YccC
MAPEIRDPPVLPGKATPDEVRIGWLRQQLARLRKRLPLRRRLVGGTAHGLMSASAALIAYVPTQALNLREGFWSAITAIAVVQTEFRATRTMARDQFLGAATGGLIGLAVLSGVGQDLVAYAVAVILSLIACWLLNVASAGRLAGITATIILLVPHHGTAERMFGSRLLEVGWGVSVAVAVGWVATRMMRHAEDES